jgi:hypothetical protein
MMPDELRTVLNVTSWIMIEAGGEYTGEKRLSDIAILYVYLGSHSKVKCRVRLVLHFTIAK